MRYLTNCVGSDGDSIRDMIDGAHDISRRTFLRYVDKSNLARIEQNLGYAPATSRNGELRMANDWHVSYSRSTYQGQPCVYFTWSAIEHIFTEGGGDDGTRADRPRPYSGGPAWTPPTTARDGR